MRGRGPYNVWALGVGRGERVASLLGGGPELYPAALGTPRNTSVSCPVSPAFGPAPIESRLRPCSVRALVTAEELCRRKVAGRRDQLPQLEHVLIVGPYPRRTRRPSHSTPCAAKPPRRSRPGSDPQEMPLPAALQTPRAPSVCTRRCSPTTPSPPLPWICTSWGTVPRTRAGRAPLTHDVALVVDPQETTLAAGTREEG